MIDKNIALNKKLEARIKEQDKQIAELSKRIEIIDSFRQEDRDNLYIVTETVLQMRNVASSTIRRLISRAYEAHSNRIDEIFGKENDGIMESFLDKDPAEMTLVFEDDDEEIYY